MQPCMNPSCRSHGKPHPNCKCYGYAKGGRVENFCALKRNHDESCEYYAAGGEINPAEVQIDQKPQEPINPAEVKLDAEPHIDTAQVQVDQEQPGDKYSTTEQKIKSALEGAAQGFAGPLATHIETKYLGVNPEDIKGRAETNPLIHGGAEAAAIAGSLLTGTGEAAWIAKGAEALANTAKLSKLGSVVLKTALEGISFTGSDEITKAMLSQPGSDPETPPSAVLLHVGAAGLMGALTAGAFSLGAGIIGKATAPEMTAKLEKLLVKLGESKDPLATLGITKSIKTSIDTAIYPLAGEISSRTGIPAGMAYDAIQSKISPVIDKIVGKVNPHITDAVIKSILEHQPGGVSHAVHYATQVTKGAQKALSGINSLFTAGAASQLATPASNEAKSFLKEFVEGGGTDQQMQNSMSSGDGFAEGGMVAVPNHSFSMIFPEQNTILNAAKGRIYNYLNSIRPTGNQQKLAFDRAPAQTDKKRSYEKAIDIAVNPTSILNHVNNGDLTTEHMQHFKSLYPEVHNYLSKEMTKRIMKAQLKDEKPPYKKRQAMSLFLGADLDSTFTPQAISTIQGLYAAKQTQQPQPPTQKMKKGTAPLSKASNPYLTDGQARIQRSQNSKA